MSKFNTIIRELAMEAVSEHKKQLNFKNILETDKLRLLDAAMCESQNSSYPSATEPKKLCDFRYEFICDGESLQTIVEELHSAVKQKDHKEQSIALCGIGQLLLENALTLIEKRVNDAIEDAINEELSVDEEGGFKPRFSGMDSPLYNSPNL